MKAVRGLKTDGGRTEDYERSRDIEGLTQDAATEPAPTDRDDRHLKADDLKV